MTSRRQLSRQMHVNSHDIRPITSQHRPQPMTSRHQLTLSSSKSHIWGIGANTQDHPTPVSTELLAMSHVVLGKNSLVFTMTAKSLCPWNIALAQASKASARVYEDVFQQSCNACQGLAGQDESNNKNIFSNVQNASPAAPSFFWIYTSGECS